MDGVLRISGWMGAQVNGSMGRLMRMVGRLVCR